MNKNKYPQSSTRRLEHTGIFECKESLLPNVFDPTLLEGKINITTLKNDYSIHIEVLIAEIDLKL
jgi:hypothetical protein